MNICRKMLEAFKRNFDKYTLDAAEKLMLILY